MTTATTCETEREQVSLSKYSSYNGVGSEKEGVRGGKRLDEDDDDESERERERVGDG